MKRRNALSLIACGLMAAFAPLSYANDVKSVGVTAIVDHPALDDVRKGVEDELKAQGFVPGKVTYLDD